MTSQDHGAKWEETVIAECDFLRAARRGRVRKRTNPLKILHAYKGRGASRGMVVCVLQPQEALDFEGVLQGGRVHGVAVFFDAKSTEHVRRFELKMITDEQLEYARERAECGALVGIYLQRRDPVTQLELGRYWLEIRSSGTIADFYHTRSVKPDKRASIRWDELEDYRLTPRELWLDGALRLDLGMKIRHVPGA